MSERHPEGASAASGGTRPRPEIGWTGAREFLLRRLRHELRGRDPGDLQDLAQEALVRLLRACRRREARNPEALMTAIARRTAIDHFRRTRRWQRLVTSAAEPEEIAVVADPETPEDSLERLRFVALEFFAARGEVCHELALAYFDCRDWVRVARETGRSHDAVRRQWSRCLAALRAEAARRPGWLSDRIGWEVFR